MKELRTLICFLAVSLGFVFFACDDSGTNPPNIPSGTVSLNISNIQPLDAAVDGVYQLWVLIQDTSIGGGYFKNLGRFNITSTGNLVDSAGNYPSFKFGADSLLIPSVKYALVTVEEPGTYNPNPGPSVLIAGPMTLYRDSVSGVMTFNDTLALGTVGSNLLSVDRGLYIIKNTTDPAQGCSKGLWFCDTLGNHTLPDGIDLNPGGGWKYEGWVYDRSTGAFYFMGSFLADHQPDSDGSGPCSGPNPTTFNVPGQEWTVSGCSTLTNLQNGTTGVFITLDPIWRNATVPFFLKVFEQATIDQSLGCGQQDNIFSKKYSLPKARLHIAR